MPALIEFIGTPENTGYVRRSAFSALGSIGPQAKGAVPTLIAIVKNVNDVYRPYAAEALGMVGKGVAKVKLDVVQ